MREGGTKVMLRGIFIGAKVSRGTDWEWSNQDGGRGNCRKNYVLFFNFY